jgi:hypothetical protein
VIGETLKMASRTGEKRKHRGQSTDQFAKKLKAIEDKQDSLVFAVGKLLQVALTTFKAVEEGQSTMKIKDLDGNAKLTLSSMFTKIKSKTALTRGHVYVNLLCLNVYPTDVELCNEFIAKREDFEAKDVRKWWNINRHKIVK